ncbi:MAG: hypothetical protein LBI20_00950 [Holosporales bacterium]|jgi:hypothetical protein|nr:hypothetical protein [Holosporales bacterium]
MKTFYSNLKVIVLLFSSFNAFATTDTPYPGIPSDECLQSALMKLDEGAAGARVTLPPCREYPDGLVIQKTKDNEYSFGRDITIFLPDHPIVSMLDLTTIFFKSDGFVSFQRNNFVHRLDAMTIALTRIQRDDMLISWLEDLARKHREPDDPDDEEHDGE